MNSSTAIGKRKAGGTSTAAQAMHNDDANAKRKRKSSSAASPAQSPATAIAPIALANTSATSLSTAPEASADGALVIASTAAAATAPLLHTASSSSSTTTTPALSAVQNIAPPLPIASATPPETSPAIALKGTATASPTTAQDNASTAIAGYALRSRSSSSLRNDSSTSPDSNNEDSVIGSNGIVNLDEMFQAKLEDELATTSTISVDDYLLPTGDATKDANRDVENRFLSMTTPDGKPMFKRLSKSSKPNQLGPRRKEDQEFHDDLQPMMKLVRNGMSRKELKKYGRINLPTKTFTATAKDDHRINPGGTGSGDKIVLAAMTSQQGKFPFRRWVFGTNGKRTREYGTRSGGDVDPKSVHGMLGGRYSQLNNMKPGDIRTGYRRDMFEITCHESEEDPAFIARREEAELNKDKLARALEWCDMMDKMNNGLKSGTSIIHYKILLSPDAMYENDEEEEEEEEGVVIAKAKGDYAVTKAIGQRWDSSTSDDIPRFKGKKRSDCNIQGKDLERLLKDNNRARINGYIVAKFQSSEEYDACHVSDSLTYEKVKGRRITPKALPKRVMKR